MVIIPILLLLTFIIAIVKKIPLYDSFTEGIKDALKLMLNLLPYLMTIFFAIELLRASGLSAMLSKLLERPFSLLEIPKELSELLILRPLSGSGSLVVLQNIYDTYGVDSYPARVASVLMGSTDTIMYVVAVYFSSSKNKKSGLAIPISIFVSLAATFVACLLCKIM
ncbi:MAG: nucleoside recognition domain-containing protein [Clostridia bacterium]|nr:nucleoside recognition domain-containing protein [Clostridia bacterium]